MLEPEVTRCAQDGSITMETVNGHDVHMGDNEGLDFSVYVAKDTDLELPTNCREFVDVVENGFNLIKDVMSHVGGIDAAHAQDGGANSLPVKQEDEEEEEMETAVTVKTETDVEEIAGRKELRVEPERMDVCQVDLVPSESENLVPYEESFGYQGGAAERLEQRREKDAQRKRRRRLEMSEEDLAQRRVKDAMRKRMARQGRRFAAASAVRERLGLASGGTGEPRVMEDFTALRMMGDSTELGVEDDSGVTTDSDSDWSATEEAGTFRSAGRTKRSTRGQHGAVTVKTEPGVDRDTVQHDQPHECGICGRRYKLLKNLNQHVGEVHILECDECGEAFPSEPELERHIVGHGTTRPARTPPVLWPTTASRRTPKKTPVLSLSPRGQGFHCELCGKSFKDNWHLNRHLHSHAGVGDNRVHVPFQCAVCDRAFFDQWHLTRHVRSHGGDDDVISAVIAASISAREAEVRPEVDLKLDLKKMLGGRELRVKLVRIKMEEDEVKHVGEELEEMKTEEKETDEDKATKETGTQEEKEKQAESETDSETPDFQCSLCSRAFWSEKLLNIHMRAVHDGEDGGHVVTGDNEEDVNKSNNQDQVGDNEKHVGVSENHLAKNESENDVNMAESEKHVEVGDNKNDVNMGDNDKHTEVGDNEIQVNVGDNKNDVKVSDKENHVDVICDEVSETHVTKEPDQTAEGEKDRGKEEEGGKMEASSGETPQIQHNTEQQSDAALALTPDGRIPCDMCNKAFLHVSMLRIHQKAIHSGATRNPLQCAVCAKVLTNQEQFEQHKAHAHPRRRATSRPARVAGLICAVCGREFKTRLEMLRHRIKEHTRDEGEKHCEECGEEFPSHVALQSHQRSVHSQNLRPAEPQNIHCEFCGKVFRQHLARHISTVHTEENRARKCYACGEEFGEVAALLEHCQTHAEKENPFRCADCGKRFKFEEILKKHQKQTCENMAACDECYVVFNTRKKFLHHLRLKHNRPASERFACDVCGKGFRHTGNLEHHWGSHFGVEEDTLFDSVGDNMKATSKCDECGKVTTNLEKHKRNHHMGLQCDECGKLCTSIRQLTNHKETHGEKIQCHVCGVALKKSSLPSHMRIQHSDNPRPHKCDVCHRGFASASLMKRHRTVHTGERPHICDTCGNSYRLSRTLRLHINRQHTHPRQFECEMCGKRFGCHQRLKEHTVSLHTDERNHVCAKCGQAYSTYMNLYHHRQRKHSDTKRFKCKTCSKAFFSSNQLAKHVTTMHKPKKQCDICGKTLGSDQKLQNHKKVMHPEKRLRRKCDGCDRFFWTDSVFERHQKTHQRELYPFPCKMCDNDAFATYDALDAHILTHPRLKPFHCDQCDESFISQSALDNHTNRFDHERGRFVRPYVSRAGKNTSKIPARNNWCDICNKRFPKIEEHRLAHARGQIEVVTCALCNIVCTEQKFLDRHMARIHGKAREGETEHCDLCGKGFLNMKGLTNHFKLVHDKGGARVAKKRKALPRKPKLEPKRVMGGDDVTQYQVSSDDDVGIISEDSLSQHDVKMIQQNVSGGGGASWNDVSTTQPQQPPGGAIIRDVMLTQPNFNPWNDVSMSQQSGFHLSFVQQLVAPPPGLIPGLAAPPPLVPAPIHAFPAQPTPILAQPAAFPTHLPPRQPAAPPNVTPTQPPSADSSPMPRHLNVFPAIPTPAISKPRDREDHVVRDRAREAEVAKAWEETVHETKASPRKPQQQKQRQQQQQPAAPTGRDAHDALIDDVIDDVLPDDEGDIDASIFDAGIESDDDDTIVDGNTADDVANLLDVEIDVIHVKTEVKEEALLECDSCYTVFAFPADLHSHVCTRADPSSLCCDHCDRRFSSEPLLTAHRQTHIGDFSVKCEPPSEGAIIGDVTHVLDEKRTLRLHVLRLDPDDVDSVPFNDTIYCRKCGRTFVNDSSIFAHSRHTCAAAVTFTCAACDRGFGSNWELLQHEAATRCRKRRRNDDDDDDWRTVRWSRFKVKDTGSVLCDVCCAEVSSEARLREHRKRHEWKHACPFCTLTFNEMYDLRRHQFRHRPDREFHCDECGKTYRDMDNFSRHIKSHEMGEQAKKKQFNCGMCGEGFDQSQAKLRAHQREVHHIGLTKKGECICLLCDLVEVRRQSMQAHMRCHADNGEGYVCAFCARAFSEKPELVEHTKTHSGPTPYECKDCDRKYSMASSLRKHRVKHTGHKPYVCDECGYSAIKKSSLFRHKLKKHVTEGDIEKREELERELERDGRMNTADRPFVCDECGKAFRTNNDLNYHKWCHSEHKRFQCDLCGFGCVKKSRLAIHKLAKHTTERPHKCDECGEGFLVPQRLKKHKLKHAAEACLRCDECNKVCWPDWATLTSHRESQHPGHKPHRCDVCDMGFTTPYAQENHRKMAHESPAKCDTCGEVFPDAVALRQHDLKRKCANRKWYQDRRKSGDPARKRQCDQCGKEFRTNKALKDHETLHTGEKPHVCDACGEAFRTKKMLAEHKEMEHSDQTYICAKCGQVFKLSRHLRDHIKRFHNAARPRGFDCEPCKQAFIQRGGVEMHKENHDASIDALHCASCRGSVRCTHRAPTPRNFHCDVCGKAFTGAMFLSRHMEIHTGIKRFSCDLCGKAFNQKVAMKAHRMTHTGERPHRCDLCGKGFIQRTNLNTHRKKCAEGGGGRRGGREVEQPDFMCY